jgi:hypothetical protein
MKDCPECLRSNPDRALRCSCGYDFPSSTVKGPYLTAKDKRFVGKTVISILLFLAAIVAAGVFFQRDAVSGVLGVVCASLIVAMSLMWEREFSMFLHRLAWRHGLSRRT